MQYDAVSAQNLAFRQMTSDTRTLWCTEEFVVNLDCKEPRSGDCKTSPYHHPPTTVPDGRYEVFVLMCCVWFSALSLNLST